MIITARIAIATALSSAISSSEVRALKGWWITRLFQNRVGEVPDYFITSEWQNGSSLIPYWWNVLHPTLGLTRESTGPRRQSTLSARPCRCSPTRHGGGELSGGLLVVYVADGGNWCDAAIHEGKAGRARPHGKKTQNLSNVAGFLRSGTGGAIHEGKNMPPCLQTCPTTRSTAEQRGHVRSRRSNRPARSRTRQPARPRWSTREPRVSAKPSAGKKRPRRRRSGNVASRRSPRRRQHSKRPRA